MSIAAYRTPEERFDAVPDYPWEARYRDWEGLRLAHLDEGSGEPIVLLHGEPTWSFLWRKVMPPLLDAGFRCIAPDLPGFGRSDKPTDLDWYSYDRHAEATAALLDDLNLREATFVLHDWGGPIGFRVATEQPERCARFAVMDTGVFTGRQKMTDAWLAFRDFVERTEDLPVSMLVRRACATDPGDEVAAAYDAPFPEARAKAGARAFPLLLPTTPDAPGASAGQQVADALEADRRPALVLWAESDSQLPLEAGSRLADRFGWPDPEPIAEASHFLQEDQGQAIGSRIASWLSETS
jgi:haloalkane dehalogenase